MTERDKICPPVKSYPRVIAYRGLPLIVLGNIFPPHPSFSKQKGVSSKNREMYGGKSVLDMGTGCGVRAVIASYAGAREVLAVDISKRACRNTRLNTFLHQRSNIITLKSDLFSCVQGEFDAIVAYLPSVDAEIKHEYEIGIHDPGFRIYARFFREAKDFLAPKGKIYSAFLNQPNIQFCYSLLSEYEYRITRERIVYFGEQEWHFLEIMRGEL